MYADEHYSSLFGGEQRPASEGAIDELAEP